MTTILTVLFLLSLTGVCMAQSEETGTTEEILNILKQKGVVTAEEYENLRKKAEAEAKKKETDYTVKWNNGINVNRNDGAFKVKIGGRIHFDWALVDPDSSLENNENNGAYGSSALKGDGVEFRRARLYVDGTLWERFPFKAQYDFAGGEVGWKDVYLGMKDIPVVGELLVGQMHEPFSLEELTSSNYNPFIERSLPTGAFAPSRKSGIRASNAVLGKRMTWAAGLFYGDTDDDGDSNFDDIANTDFTLRVTGLPIYADKGGRLLHLGLGYSYQMRDEGETDLRYRNRPETHLTDVRLVDTGNFDSDGASLLNPEIAFVWGPFSFQGEYFWTSVDSNEANDPSFQGAYVFGTWFITGENRAYSTSSGKFSRVKPNGNFMDGGIGAWEVGLRWSWLDLNDENIQGGEETNITFGLNWYLNPNYRILFNYIYADVQDRGPFEDDDGNLIATEDGSANIFTMRFQVDF
jgi:phosphate-selective porin OprO/OprP